MQSPAWLPLSIACILLGACGEVSSENYEFSVGDIMMLHLQRSYFFSDRDADADDPVRYIASTLGDPDVPSWLTFLQRDPRQDAFLYGSPDSVEDTTSIEVVAINERTYQTAYKLYNITVHSADKDLSKLNVVELWILNMDVEELLGGPHMETIQQKMSRMWKGASDLRLVKVTTVENVSGRTPVPLQPGHNIKEGVVLQFGAFEEFSRRLLGIKEQIKDGRCDAPNDPREVTVEESKRFEPGYTVSWCNFMLMEAVQSEAMVATEPALTESVPWYPRSQGVARRQTFMEFVVVVLVPLAVTLVMFIVLSSVMFGRREGREKRDRETSESQLMQYYSIRQATSNLRYMSSQREVLPSLTPRLGRTPATTPAPSAANTLNRMDKLHVSGSPTQVLPPYRIPPAFPRDSSPGYASDNDTGRMSPENQLPPDGQQLTPSSSETLKVRK